MDCNQTMYPFKNKRMTYKNIHGFTLLELMIVVVIISILASISIYQYQGLTDRARRADGTAMLMKVMNLQERYYGNQFPPSYADSLDKLGYADNKAVSEEGFYEVSASACQDQTLDNCVLLSATPQGSQNGDGVLTLNNYGVRTRGSNSGWGDN